MRPLRRGPRGAAAAVGAVLVLVAGATSILGGDGTALAASSRAAAGTVLVTDLDTNSVATINPTTGAVSSVYGAGLNGPLGIAVSPDGLTAYVTNSLGNTVSPIDLSSFPFRVESPIKVGGAPSAIALSPNGAVAYVSDFNSNTVTPIYLSSRSAQPAIHVGSGPWSLAVSTDGSKVIVSNSEATTVSVIDVDTRHVTTLKVGGRPEAIAVSPRTDVAYVLSGSDVVPIALSSAAPSLGSPIVVVNKPVGISINPSGTTAYTVNADNTVTRIDLALSPARVSSPVQVGSLSQADGVAISPDGKRAYIANATNTVTPISLATGSVLAQTPVSVGAASFGVAVVPDQAPLARFTEKIRAAGRASVFNASASRSPNGQIASYHWNFGNGVSRVTTSAIVKYRYPQGRHVSRLALGRLHRRHLHGTDLHWSERLQQRILHFGLGARRGDRVTARDLPRSRGPGHLGDDSRRHAHHDLQSAEHLLRRTPGRAVGPAGQGPQRPQRRHPRRRRGR